jgi:hypothetical protein
VAEKVSRPKEVYLLTVARAGEDRIYCAVTAVAQTAAHLAFAPNRFNWWDCSNLFGGNRWISNEPEQYCSELALESCAHRESPNGRYISRVSRSTRRDSRTCGQQACPRSSARLSWRRCIQGASKFQDRVWKSRVTARTAMSAVTPLRNAGSAVPTAMSRIVRFCELDRSRRSRSLE